MVMIRKTLNRPIATHFDLFRPYLIFRKWRDLRDDMPKVSGTVDALGITQLAISRVSPSRLVLSENKSKIHQKHTWKWSIRAIWPRSGISLVWLKLWARSGAPLRPSRLPEREIRPGEGKLEEAPVPEFPGPYFLLLSPSRSLFSFSQPCQAAPSPAPKTPSSAWDELATSTVILAILVAAAGRSSSPRL